MLTLKLRLHKELPDDGKDNPFLNREDVLKRALARCIFKVGDYVRIKKHLPRNTIAKVMEIETDIGKINWGANNITPNCVKLQIPIVDRGTKQVRGYHETWVTPRKCIFERIGTGE